MSLNFVHGFNNYQLNFIFTLRASQSNNRFQRFYGPMVINILRQTTQVLPSVKCLFPERNIVEFKVYFFNIEIFEYLRRNFEDVNDL